MASAAGSAAWLPAEKGQIKSWFSPKPGVVGANAVLVVRVSTSNGFRAYRFVDVPQFNLQLAGGQQVGTYPLEVGSGN